MKQKGFTILETIVAVTTLAIVITGVTAAMQTGISSYITSKDQTTAIYLAQESFEQIRHIRDQNALTGNPWLTGISGAVGTEPCYPGFSCYSDAINGTLTRCISTCPLLLQDPVNKFYGYTGGWTTTNFRRTIQLSVINVNEVSIVVTVAWSKGSLSKSLVFKENFLNWP